jgi:hypothetical protein
LPFRVEFVGECLDPARRFLDLGICVLHVITSSSKEPVELGTNPTSMLG